MKHLFSNRFREYAEDKLLHGKLNKQVSAEVRWTIVVIGITAYAVVVGFFLILTFL